MKEYLVGKPEDFDAVAQEVAKSLKPGMILALSGPLGAGKTTFVQALARELGVERMPRSPTFSLVRTYSLPVAKRGLRRLVHVDAYRLEKPEDFQPLDLDEELAESGTVVAIEWAERASEWMKRRRTRVRRLTIEPLPDGGRLVRFF